MASIQIRELKILDNAVFGREVIIRQSSSKIKEASMFIKNTASEHRRLEKAKRDNTTILQGQTVYQRTGSSISEIQEDENSTKNTTSEHRMLEKVKRDNITILQGQTVYQRTGSSISEKQEAENRPKNPTSEHRRLEKAKGDNTTILQGHTVYQRSGSSISEIQEDENSTKNPTSEHRRLEKAKGDNTTILQGHTVYQRTGSSNSEIQEAENRPKNPTSEHRRLEKAKRDNTTILKGQTVYQRSGSLISEIQEDENRPKNPTSEHRILEKAKRDNTTILQGQTVYQRSGSPISEIQEDKNRTTIDFKYKNGVKWNYDQKEEYISLRNWNSVEFPTMTKQRRLSNYYSEYKSNLSTLPSRINESHTFHYSLSQIFCHRQSAAIEAFPSYNRYLPLSSRKSISFYRSSLHYYECSTEEQNEIAYGNSAYFSEPTTDDENEVDYGSPRQSREPCREGENEVDNDSSTLSFGTSTEENEVDNGSSTHSFEISTEGNEVDNGSSTHSFEISTEGNEVDNGSSTHSFEISTEGNEVGNGSSTHSFEISTEGNEVDNGSSTHSFEIFTKGYEVDNDSSTHSFEIFTEGNEVDNGSSTHSLEIFTEGNEVDNGSSASENCIKSRAASVNDSRLCASHLVDKLLSDIYGKYCGSGVGSSLKRSDHSAPDLDYCSTSGSSMSWKRQARYPIRGKNGLLQQWMLKNKTISELEELLGTLRFEVKRAGSYLVGELKIRDALTSIRDERNDVITAILHAVYKKRSQDTRIRFSLKPYPGDNAFTQWQIAMKMAALLPGGIPPEIRRRLWLTVADKHLQSRGVDWSQAERFCFNEGSNPDDDKLGVQIIKDLHRTGCPLFFGAVTEKNQKLLKRVLLAYARWNKAVGYCQGFNMLATVILQAMNFSEADALKVMICLIEGVLPESYFANNLRGLSVDMAVFRDLVRLRLPTLSRHLEQLQDDSRRRATDTDYEPPLTNVLTMQWFLTLFSICLPQSTVFRVWDLIFLEGNVVLQRTALVILSELADRIMAIDRCDKFYSIMTVLTRDIMFGLIGENNLIKKIVNIEPFPFPQLSQLREKYLYNIMPWTFTVPTTTKHDFSDDDDDGDAAADDDDDDSTDKSDEKVSVPAANRITALFRSQTKYSLVPTEPQSSSSSAKKCRPATPCKNSLALDMLALQEHYTILKKQQRQSHIILTAARARQSLGQIVPTPTAMNHLQLGRSAVHNVRCRRNGPPPLAVPHPENIASKFATTLQRGPLQPQITPQEQFIVASNVKIMLPQLQQPKCKKQRGVSQDATLARSVLSVGKEERKTSSMRMQSVEGYQ
jgi:hypothetical protein